MSDASLPSPRPAAPPVLVGAALLLWGVAIGAWPVGLLLAAAYEWARWRSPAWEADRFAMQVVVGGSLLAVVGGLVLAVIFRGTPQALYLWLRWLPLGIAPVAVLAASATGLRVVALATAFRAPTPTAGKDRSVDLSHTYAAVALGGAAVGGGLQRELYFAFAGLVAWALLARVARGARRIGFVMVLAAAVLGYGLHVGISTLQGRVEDWGTEWIMAGQAARPDPTRERTRIGDLGQVKLSDRIVLRVESPPRLDALLLREAAFDQYVGGEWRADRKAPHAVPRDGERWMLAARTAAASRMVLRRASGSGDALLPLPLGTQVLDGLAAERVDAFPGGALLARGLPSRASATVVFDEGGERNLPDPARDLLVPPALATLFASVLREQGLQRDSGPATVAAVHAYFERDFRYSVALGDNGRSLSNFLLRDRQGHCEYFATATVLLLRQAGIPARYVGGYSVQEYSPRERAYVVRARHAHAWSIAFVDGRWTAVDTTPGGWAQADAEVAANALSPLLDTGSWLLDLAYEAWAGLRFSTAAGLAAAGALLCVVAVVFAWRVLRSRRGPRNHAPPAGAVARAWLQVEQRLGAAGHSRGRDETVRAWARRLGAEADMADLERLAQAYYRARFDPSVHAAAVQEFLRQAESWQAPRGSA